MTNMLWLNWLDLELPLNYGLLFLFLKMDLRQFPGFAVSSCLAEMNGIDPELDADVAGALLRLAKLAGEVNMKLT